MKRVTTVIVNYRLKYFLEQTLLSVEEAYTEVDGRTIVIDNNSGDDSIDFLEERFPSVTFIRNKENVGFAKANNQGFALADTDFIPDEKIHGTENRENQDNYGDNIHFLFFLLCSDGFC